jgi:uncharacterized protein YkwD
MLPLILAATLAQNTSAGSWATRPPDYPTVRAYSVTESAGWFLVTLNGERRRRYLPPVSWDANLAAYAARNTSYHSPASRAPYSSQTWAGTRSYQQAYSMWMQSPAHRSILLGARQSIGISPCPSGMTCNAR